MSIYSFKFEASRALKKALRIEVANIFGFFILLFFQWYYIVCWSFNETNALTKDFVEDFPRGNQLPSTRGKIETKRQPFTVVSVELRRQKGVRVMRLKLHVT